MGENTNSSSSRETSPLRGNLLETNKKGNNIHDFFKLIKLLIKFAAHILLLLLILLVSYDILKRKGNKHREENQRRKEIKTKIKEECNPLNEGKYPKLKDICDGLREELRKEDVTEDTIVTIAKSLAESLNTFFENLTYKAYIVLISFIILSTLVNNYAYF